jgi:hypothetical protein
MAIIRESPRIFNSTSTGAIVTASSGPTQHFEFGFLTSYLRIENIGTVDIWLKLNSTGVATTSDHLIRACEPSRLREFSFNGPIGPAMVSLGATSTVASGAAVFAVGQP